MIKSDSSEKQVTPRQLKFICLLLSAKSQEAALRQANLSRQTLATWMKNPRFSDELKRRRDELINEAFEALKRSAKQAAEVLIALLKSSNEHIRRHAANDVIDHVLRARELEQVVERISVLEEIVTKKGRQYEHLSS